jgi:hypothetical protein
MKLMHTGLIISVCLHDSAENHWLVLNEFWYGYYAIWDNSKISLFNSLLSVIPTWRTKNLCDGIDASPTCSRYIQSYAGEYFRKIHDFVTTLLWKMYTNNMSAAWRKEKYLCLRRTRFCDVIACGSKHYHWPRAACDILRLIYST